MKFKIKWVARRVIASSEVWGAPPEYVTMQRVYDYDNDNENDNRNHKKPNSKGTKTDQIVDGEEKSWDFNLNLPTQGLHDLTVTIDQGQDRININHLVDILYTEDEGSPNPYQVADETEDDESESE